MNDRDRNDSGQFADGIEPDTVLDVFDARDDLARPITAGDVVDELEIARRTAHNKLGNLVERGTLKTRKIGARGRVYWRPIPADTDDTQGGENAHTRREIDPILDESNGSDTTENDEEATEAFDASDLQGNPKNTIDEIDDGDDPIGDALIEWEPSTEVRAKTARAQTRRAAQYLREHAPERFKKSEFVDALADDCTLGDRNWWERAVQPGLRRLEDAGIVEFRLGHHDYKWVGDD